MKNSKVTTNPTKGTVINQAVTEKTAIRPAVPSNHTVASNAVFEVAQPQVEVKTIENVSNQPTIQATNYNTVIKESIGN